MLPTKTAAAERRNILAQVLSSDFYTVPTPVQAKCILEVCSQSVLVCRGTDNPKLSSLPWQSLQCPLPLSISWFCLMLWQLEEGSVSWSGEAGKELIQDPKRCPRKCKINRKSFPKECSPPVLLISLPFTAVCSAPSIKQSKHMLRDAAYL